MATLNPAKCTVASVGVAWAAENSVVEGYFKKFHAGGPRAVFYFCTYKCVRAVRSPSSPEGSVVRLLPSRLLGNSAR